MSITKGQIDKMKEAYKALGADGLILNHYELAEQTKIKDASLWKEFLMEPEIQQYISTETAIMQQAELNKITHDISNSRSVGQAQIINSLQKLNETKHKKEGPAFIYTYVPISENQKAADNIVILDEDPFMKEDHSNLTIDDLYKRNGKPVFVTTPAENFWALSDATNEKLISIALPAIAFDKLEQLKIKCYPSEVQTKEV